MKSVAEIKSGLRVNLKRALSNLDEASRASQSASVIQSLIGSRVWAESGRILFFSPMPDEVNLWPLLQRALSEKEVFLPGYDPDRKVFVPRRLESENSLYTGKFGIREPSPTPDLKEGKPLDLILVPGLGFDRHGHRLGRGRGFYDRLLSENRGLRCGACFDEQIIESIPTEPHDITLDFLVMPGQMVRFSDGRTT